MKSDTTNNWIVCRVCLKQPDEEMRTIFDANDDKDLTNLILRCGGVPIKRFDHFPDKICNKCYKYLCVANSFRQTCQRSHQHLSKFIAPVDMENAVATASQDPIEPDISLHLGDHAVTLKMEPLESTEKDGETKEIKHELNDDMIEHFQPMHVDVPGGLIDETLDDCAISDCEFLEELNDASLSEEGYEGSSLTRKTESAKKLKSTEINKKSNKPAGSKGETIIIYKPDKKRGPKPSGQGRKPRPSTKKPKDTSYICDICGNLYPSQSRLTEHIKLHKGIKPYECEICGHAFAQTQQLARHMNTHTGRRPYKCNYCPAAFADVSTRNKHHRIHTNERPYVCDVCGKTFTYTNTLKFHKMTHTGEKPHVCDICGKAFQQAYKMRLHRLVHEKKGLKVTQEEKPAGTKIELLEI